MILNQQQQKEQKDQKSELLVDETGLSLSIFPHITTITPHSSKGSVDTTTMFSPSHTSTSSSTATSESSQQEGVATTAPVIQQQPTLQSMEAMMNMMMQQSQQQQMMQLSSPVAMPHPQQLMMQQQVQITGILYPHPHDVLCGRGGQSNSHAGNAQWRMLVATNKELYISLPKRQKMMLSQSIVNAVRSQIPPGRFLQKDVHTDLWYDVGDKRAQEKTSQALREGAPELRSKIKEVALSSETSDATVPNSCSSKGSEESAVPVSEEAAKNSESKDITSAFPQHSLYPIETTSNSTVTQESIQILSATRAVVSPPVLAGPVTSKEQMPPPPPIPVPLEKVKRVKSKEQNVPSPVPFKGPVTSKEHMPPPKVQPPTEVRTETRTKETLKQQEEHHEVLSKKAPHPVPVPTTFARGDSDRGCSYGSLRMSDYEQLTLMNSFSNELYNYSDTAQNQQYKNTANTRAEAAQATGYHSTEPLPYNNTYYNTGNYRPNNDHQHQQQHNLNPNDMNMSYHYSTHDYNMSHPQQTYLPSSSYGYNSNVVSNDSRFSQHYQQQTSIDENNAVPQPVDGGLVDSSGLSLGSVMSFGTLPKLEGAGLSIGSAMSYTPIPLVPAMGAGTFTKNTKPYGNSSYSQQQQSNVAVPDAPDGGLQEIGTSFGSMSLVEGERERITAEAEREVVAILVNEKSYMGHSVRNDMIDAGLSVPKTLLNAQKSTSNLLRCDEDENDEDDTATSAERSAQKNLYQWNMLQATLASENESIRNVVTVPPMFIVNPDQQQHGSSFYHDNSNYYGNLQVPTFGRDYSQMSAISEGEDFEPTPVGNINVRTREESHIRSDNNTDQCPTYTIENNPDWVHYENSIQQEMQQQQKRPPHDSGR